MITTLEPSSDTRISLAQDAAPAGAKALWREHGWGLGGTQVAAVVGLVMLLSGIMRMCGCG